MRYSDVKLEGGPIANNVTVVDANGAPIMGVQAATVTMRGGDPIKVSLEISMAEVKLLGKATFMLADPRTGRMKGVKRVEFADGSVFDVAAD